MVNTNKVLYNDEAMKALKQGADKLAEAVKVTLGPGGHNVIIDQGSEWLPPIVTKDGVTVARELRVNGGPEQLGAQIIKQAASKTNDSAGDGPQPLYSKVLTPSGFVPMGSLKVGDELCGTGGTIQTVLAVYPKGEKEIYKVIFTDGREVECCEDHLWFLKKASRGTEVIMTTKEILSSGVHKFNGDGHYLHKFYTPRTFAEFSNKKFVLDPYLVGLLIGDGALTGTGSIELSLGPNDRDVIDRITLPEGLSLSWRFVEKKHYYRVKIRGKTPNGETIHDLVQKIGLLGCNSGTKFIPYDYLFSDLKSREALLRGLSDTDGHINNRGLLEYSTISPQLGEDMLTLLRSLGKAASCVLLKRKPNSSYSNTSIYRINELKGDTFGNGIHDVIPTGEFTRMQCIKVSNEDNLYFTDNFIVTHNTTTSTVLAQEILNQGIKHLGTGKNGINIKRGIDLATQMVVEYLSKNSTSISLKDMAMVTHIATVSGNDPEVGKMVATAYKEVGENGLVGFEETRASETVIEIHKGMSFDRGYPTPAFVTDPKRMVCELREANVLVFERRISSAQELVGFLTEYHKNFKEAPLLIITSDIDGDALATLAANKLSNGMLWIGIKAPGFGKRASDWMEDIAALTGAKVIAEVSAAKLENVPMDVLGKAKSITINKEETSIVGGYGDPASVAEYVANLKERLVSETSAQEIEWLKLRLAKLDGSIALIKIGAQTDAEMKEKKYRFEDAINATKAALSHGIVPGGGVALLNAFEDVLARKPELSLEESVGFDILLMSLLIPLKTIAQNSGISGEHVIAVLQTSKRHKNYGYNARTGYYCDLVKEGIIDPVKVTTSAVLNAASAAGTLLTTRAVIYGDPVEPK